jgi:hypothetical protein
MSGFRGVLIYIALGVSATFIANGVAGSGAATVVGIAFLISTMFVFPWLAGRS